MIAGQDITIIGAGIAGLTLARALALRGARVTVLEQAAFITEVGAGLQIAPNGAAVIKALGLGDALARAGMQAHSVQLRDGRDGAPVLTMDLTRRALDRDYHLLHRADLIDLLAKGAVDAGAVIALGAAIRGVDLSGDYPVLDMADGTHRDARVLIGADGARSILRSAINGAADPFFTGQVAWRAVIAGGGDPDVQVFMGAGRHLVSYPLRGGAMRNIVAVEERAAWTPDSWSRRGDPAALSAAFAGFCPQVLDWLGNIQDLSEWGLHRSPVAPQWGRILPKGAAFILGDAAHPTLPFLAQGASMGIEDAWVLAETLAAYPLAGALAHYQALRAPRAARIVAAANANARNYHLSGAQRLIGHAALRVLGRAAADLMLRRFDWLYGMDVTRA